MSNELNFEVTGYYNDDNSRPDFENRCVVTKEINHVLDNTGIPYIKPTQLNECRYRFEAFPEGFDTYVWDFGDESGADSGRVINNHVFYNDGFYRVSVFMSSVCTELETDTVIELIFEDCYCYDKPINQL